MSAPLRIGILGAARIADAGIVEPAGVLGHQLVAVAARDRERARSFAAERGIARVHDTYADVIADPEVDVVYNALINSLHAEWNIAALAAGKHVLSEKPLTSNGQQARAVQAAAAQSPGWLVEGFHYIHHPVHDRLRRLVTSGALGEVRSVDLVLTIPAPPDHDPRWSLDLAGGATMDLGCYVLDAARHLGTWIGSTPHVRAATARLESPGVDSAMTVALEYGNGVLARCRWDMAAADRTMTWSVTGTEGHALSPAFAVPHNDNRLIVTRGERTDVEVLGSQTSYTYQLARLASVLDAGAPFPSDVDGSVVTADLVDACYLEAGLRPRGA